jgi:RNA polymerase sigma-70 factor (ECF subfamily)
VDIGALFDAHAEYLCRVVHRLTGSRAVAEDLVQEVFITAHRRRADLQPGTNLRAWLYRVAVNMVRHRRRGTARFLSFVDRYKSEPEPLPVDRPDLDIERMQRGRMIRACTMRMSPKLREVFVLYELEELEGAEIAEILGISVNTVWSRLRLARQRFRKEWTLRAGEGTP